VRLVEADPEDREEVLVDAHVNVDEDVDLMGAKATP
jgi:hypothetical protein